MDRYRYFIFNQRSMVVLGILQIACAGISIVSGFMDGAFRRESTLGRTRAPLWAGLIMTIPGVLALFSSQKKNPVLVNALIAASVFSCFTTLIVIVYASLTLGYGEDDDDIFSSPPHVIHARFILGKLVQGANIAMLIASVSSLCVALCIAYMGCRSLPQCMCYDDITGMDWLHPEDEQPQTVELVCTFRGGDERIFNSASQFTDCNTETEEEFSRPPPYVRFS
ncbi:hypothetical protein XENTR_v10000779 [Xenopus tropicalis]|uniref:Uncharacterized XB5734924 n=2 Tax=Xenopus tropicalis TaxID=8364 RepID=A0A803JZF4_XENTR|nr:uncharacterized protein LOC733556 isoform X1 [Xenopus tropicalis]XP_012819541.1 uncharacterized protein LOC733556 isoform X1 [Xenopus tropicalis]XP_012819544.1 uncharacterized protein LOC733556 isoform X1 [Xenopus tropicalis]XP_031756952.1 uncharacterized protein LOC733556 isoform X1 [Xenopus tropicalis]KAE8630317.1 hypothetical protein XENTR_v10000779 [Xenopus tropicalis]KAE8630318.1 hypothetical protein XENTR_v10000779 [Xenopus tropicalis]KAE8630319.1 hypothetical protein XENTR_v10000779|eukprot:XP_012819533.1 PREDICTED: uncharacterized protein LOC733556 isoform X1 [Xenopus tropicalis]